MARGIVGFKGAAFYAAVAGDRGWRLGVLGGAGGVISHDTHAAVLGTQDGECLEQAAEGIAGESQAGVQAIWMAESRAAATTALDQFIRTYEDKYPKATACLASDREALLTFYDFPAAHWQSIRTTNPIESTFATVRLRTARTRGCVSRTSLLTMVFKLALCAEQNWRRMRGFHHLADVIENVKFIDGAKAETIQQHQQAA